MVVFPSPNRTGIYRVKVNVKYGGDNFAGTTFAIQKYYATANPVDFTGEKDFWFYPPNTSIYIKLKVTDLSTREELNASKIVDAKILEMSRQWPSYTDMLSGSYKPNEAIVPGKGVLNFTTPESEGFFTFRFKFKTETGEEGLGTGFFMLKKYMIWGEPVCGQEGFCHFAPGSNITLNVKIVPIKDAEKLSKGMRDLSQIGYCTDCDGLIVSVDSIFNDQLMREIPASDYTVYNGTIFNSSANITIQPNNMPTGWFGVDLILTDPADPTKQYIGWTGFEIRRFLIITDNLEVKDGKITRKEGGGMWGPTTFGLGQEVLFAVQAMNPANFQPLPIHTVIVETVTLMSDMGPPVTLKSSDYQWSAQNITVQGFPWSVYVVNITGVNKTGNFQVTFRVVLETNSSDVWNYGFMMSRYLTETEYRGMDKWPPTFAPNENLTVNVTAFDANEQPHNLSKQGTRLKMVNKMKTDTRLKLNYSVECVENKCTIDIYCPTVTDLSCLGSGEFSAIIGINDTQGVQMEEEVYFEIKGLTVSIPSIEEFWIGRTDTTTKEFELGNDRDTCENERWLNFDELPGNFKDSSPGKVGNGVLLHDNCTEYDNKTICIGSPPNSWNFTISFNKTANTTAMVYCVYPNGTWTFENLMACEGNGNYTYLVSNLTHMWVKLNESYENPVNMTEIEPLTEGGNFEASGIKWYVRKIGKVWNCQPNCNWYDSDMWFLVTAENFFDLQGVSNQFNCSDPVSVRFNVSETYPENFAGVFCVLNQTTEVYESCGGQQNKANKTAFNLVSGSCPSNEGNTIYIYSNSTHLWINGTADLTKSSPLTNGDTLIIGEREWKVSSVGENEQGNPQLNMFNVMVNDLVRICMNQQQCFNLTVADKYENNRGSVFCVQGNGEWSDQNLAGCTPKIYIYSNTTHVWLNGSNDLTETPVRSKNNIFDFAGRTWKIADLDENKLEVKLAGNRICGWDDNQTYVLELPGEYEYNYHQYQRNLIDNWIKQDPKFVPFNYSRPVYIYHNTTHVWINNETNMSKVNPASINGILTDPYGGQWKVKLISKRSLKLEGQNVLAETGAFINTSYSRSGIIRIEPVREEWLGGWDQMQGKQRGFDLDGDGLTNGTVYIAVADNATAGIYDTFFFSKTNNFSNPISINANPSQRKFGYGENKLTLLSISSVSGVQVKAYSDKPSDWANLGQFKVGSVVRVPVIVKMPSGDDGVANVSVNIIKIEIPGQPSQFITLLSPPHAIIDGIGEITINFTTINLNQSGEYSLGIRAVNESTEEKLEEWKWPRVMMKRFLADSSVGDGGYVGEFKQLPLYRYDWDNYGDWIPEIRTEVVQPTNTIFEGIFASVPQEIPHEQCPNFEDPAEAGTGQNWTFVLYNPFDYYLYINSQNESKVWIKKGDCNFTTNTQLKNVGEQVKLTLYGNTYMLYVLYVNVTEGSKAAFIGLPGVNSSVMKPIRMDGNRPTWRLMAVNISGTLYDVLMANSTNDYPMCTIQNFYECIKMAWFSTTGNFSEAIPAAIGQNFTSNLYLAKIGPGSWDMLTIGDFSQIASLNIHPAVDVRVRDNTPSYFAKLDESVLNLDLNKNGDLNDVFYAIAFDEKQDFSNTLTDVMVDDDWNITEDWWHDSLNNYKDFYGDETGIKEMRSGLPRGIWNGNIRFNESSENTPWEKRPEWDILLYNYTHMLLRKWKDWFNKNENITIVLRVFEFNQSGIANADVTIDKLMYYGSGFPIQLQTPQDYNTTVNVKTDANGYAVIKITRNSNWQLGQYNVRVKVSKEGKVETTDNWFNVQP
ncbi:MAG: hypothetical protein QXO27_03880 [Candidatus Aenigmatarchaeota archaeon]